ncbi:MAG: hypothetical protein JWM11_1858 [Planctomycetaceae bacterium]|nr:hypothetical protein [Planctomycetaceae bacterium]
MKSMPVFISIAFLLLFGSMHNAAVRAYGKPAGTIDSWETIVDPDQDCEFVLNDKKLSINVPGTNHDLTTTGGQKAPRALKRVSSDFTVQVKVTADFKPGMTAVGNTRPYNGAGIVIWQNEQNFLRVERNAYWLDPQTLFCYPPLIAYWNNNSEVGEINSNPTNAEFFKGKSTWLRANRQGSNVTVSISHDGKNWAEIKKFQVQLADQLFVGVAAVNTSGSPFRVEFEEFTIKAR